MSEVRFSRALFVAAAVLFAAGCEQPSNRWEQVSQIAVGRAQAASPAPTLWHERGPDDPLPAGVVPMPSLAPLVKSVKPSVVNVYTTSVARARPRPGGPNSGDPFEEFFRRFHEGAPDTQSQRQSLGSGFIISSDGLVVTNNHVVEGAAEIRVRLDDGREFAAKAVGRDPKTDVAVLKLQSDAALKNLPAAWFGNSDSLEVGDLVVAVGNPFGLDHSVSMGIVSAKERVIGAGPYDDFVQTDAAINPGNSGGPLFNARGEVVGVNTAIVAQGQGIGFAVPINMVKELLPQLVGKGRVVRGWLGVTIQDLTPELARSLGIEKAQGALVAQVQRKGPADAAGLQSGDVVVAVNGRRVESYNQLSRFVAFLSPGKKARLQVIRDGKERALDVLVGPRPDEEGAVLASAGEAAEPSASDALGIAVAPVGQEIVQRFGIDGGVQIARVSPESPAGRAGARPGDVIVELQKRPIRSMKDYNAAVSTLRKGELALMRLQRQDASIYVAVQIPR